MKKEANNNNDDSKIRTNKNDHIPNCFECGNKERLIKDSNYTNTHWCEKHYKEKHSIMSDFMNHAFYGT